MNYYHLKNTGLHLSVVGLGAWPFSSGYDWSNIDAPDVASVLSAARESGINWIDTAPIYEESEKRLGAALKGRREQFVLATKCGLVKNGAWTDHDLHPATLQKQLENSLRTLRTDVIDLYQIHYPDPTVALEDALAVLFRFREQGKIRAIGVCNITEQQLLALPAEVDSVQQEFSLIHAQKGKKLLDACQKKQIAFLGYGTLGGGILSGKYKQEPNFRRADARNYFYKCYRGESFDKLQPLLARVSQLAQQKRTSMAGLSVAWALSYPGVSSVLVGAKTTAQVLQNAQGAVVHLNEEEKAYLEGL